MAEDHFDAVVVGSGFGGAVMAHRLAGHGLRVCVLERGDAYPPNGFPRSPHEMGRNLWDPSEGLYGLFDIWAFKRVWSVVASGLGGGSLVYANVLIRKPPTWFEEDRLGEGSKPWPIQYTDLVEHYEHVEHELGATPYPFRFEPYSQTPKTRELAAAAQKIKGRYFLPDLAVSFAEPGKNPGPGAPLPHRCNLHCESGQHAYRSTCRLCGECVFGCNFGSKNTLDLTLLSDAAAPGKTAELRTLSEVRRIEPVRDGGGAIVHYRVTYQELDRGRRRGELPPGSLQTIDADRVVLAAGTFGTTHLLLKMKRQGYLPNLSPALGTRFSTNGDYPTVALKCRDGRRPRLMEPGRGPAITSAFQRPDRLDVGGETEPGLFMEEGGYPEHLNYMIETIGVGPAIGRSARVLLGRVLDLLRGRRNTNLSAELSYILGPATTSSTAIPLLLMGRDVPNGRITLAGKNRNWLRLDWKQEASRAFFSRAEATAKEWADQLGGKLQKNPLSYFGRNITVHPLGGCPMADNREEGVVDPWGRVFDYPGLYVADGSVMPGPIGVNPALTIAAVADRFAKGITESLQRP
jgi:cholesterol oxidase